MNVRQPGSTPQSDLTSTGGCGSKVVGISSQNLPWRAINVQSWSISCVLSRFQVRDLIETSGLSRHVTRNLPSRNATHGFANVQHLFLAPPLLRNPMLKHRIFPARKLLIALLYALHADLTAPARISFGVFSSQSSTNGFTDRTSALSARLASIRASLVSAVASCCFSNS